MAHYQYPKYYFYTTKYYKVLLLLRKGKLITDIHPPDSFIHLLDVNDQVAPH